MSERQSQYTVTPTLEPEVAAASDFVATPDEIIAILAMRSVDLFRKGKSRSLIFNWTGFRLEVFDTTQIR